VKVGRIFGFTVMLRVAVVAHCPAVGVNVYVVVVVLSKAGDQVPVYPLREVVGKAVNVPPSHIGATAVKVGRIFGFTVMLRVAVVAHCPAVGVNVYVVVVVLSKVGDQVPVYPLREVVGKAVNVPPSHIGATAVNVGSIFGFTVMVSVAVVAHCPAVGVKV
jgi:hypothetical protein